MIIRSIVLACVFLLSSVIAIAQDEISLAVMPNFPFRPKVVNPSPIGMFGDRVLSISGTLDFTHFKPKATFGYRAGITGGTIDYTYHSIVTLGNGFKFDVADLPENFTYLGLSLSGLYRKEIKPNLQIEISAGLEKRFYRYANESDTSGYTFGTDPDQVIYRISTNSANDQLKVSIPTTISIRQRLSKRSALTTGITLNFGLSPIRKATLYVSNGGTEYFGSYNISSSFAGFDLRYSYSIGQTINGLSKPQTDAESHKKAVFFELLGSGMLYSLNYDFRLRPNSNQGIGFRVGLGKGSYTSNETFGNRYTTLPLNVNYIFGRKRSGLEAGISLTPEFSFQSFDDKFNFYSILNLGYRYQPINKGLLFRLAYTPLLTGGNYAAPLGISVGYGFR